MLKNLPYAVDSLQSLDLIICIAVYCARDARLTSSCIIASITELSVFDALHANTVAKITISIH